MPSLVVLPGLWSSFEREKTPQSVGVVACCLVRSVLVCIEGMRVDMPIEHNSSLTKPSQEAHICDREHRGAHCLHKLQKTPHPTCCGDVLQTKAQTVMNADLAKIHGIEHGQDLVAAAWEDYKASLLPDVPNQLA
eukprot:1206847-Amphidinium_carterae.1